MEDDGVDEDDLDDTSVAYVREKNRMDLSVPRVMRAASRPIVTGRFSCVFRCAMVLSALLQKTMF